ncbi:hypothetical protein AM587_10013136 [Phytophthora nicotianae]|uniref:Uncharacterized protein n=1 Tax=Phytophthora nicotianae TaxID=4792 RepID=A0A0W8D089_PHYNI|nr:hypothetical protein AM587_10013136 [Phytophthora nicotianae]
MDAGERWMEGEDVAEEELRLLEAMANVSTAMQQVRMPSSCITRCLQSKKERVIDTFLRCQFNQVLAKLNRQTVELSKELGTAERQLVRQPLKMNAAKEGLRSNLPIFYVSFAIQNALYLPFQAAIYEMQSSTNRRRTTLSVPTVTSVATPEAQRTEL